jgi:alkanesulfonate monooxygenase SsuD/methylene tetrahydromethanopterin reductase-like flavin-dependent oxidoreductase (luciferase family)
MRIIRLFWSGERSVSFAGEHYRVSGLHPGPAPAHPIEIWLGVGKPRAPNIVGRLADGWYRRSLGAAARTAGACRSNRRGRRRGRLRPRSGVYNVGGVVIDGPARGLLQGPATQRVDALSEFALELGMDTFVFWPSEEPAEQLERFAVDVVPGVRETVERARARRGEIP